MEIIDHVLKTGEGISDFGMLIMTGAFFLVLSALLMIACFRLFVRTINEIIEGQKGTLKELLEETKTQNERLTDISEGLLPETRLRTKTVSNLCFDLSVEKVCRIIKKIREENHIADKQAVKNKIRVLLTNLHEDRNSKFDCFTYRGRKLSAYTQAGWIDRVAKVVENEIYHEAGANNGRTYTNVESVYANIRLEFYHNLNAG